VATLGYYVDAAISEIRGRLGRVPDPLRAALSMGVDALSRRLWRRLRIEMLPTRLSNEEAIAK
jgi:phosphonate transport system permease protein